MPTATAKRTQSPVVKSDTADITIDLPASKRSESIVNRFVEARLSKRDAEKAYDEAKNALDELLGNPEPLVKGQKLIAKLRSVTRVIFVGQERTDVNRDLLMQAFPEAFETCKEIGHFNRRDTV